MNCNELRRAARLRLFRTLQTEPLSNFTRSVSVLNELCSFIPVSVTLNKVQIFNDCGKFKLKVLWLGKLLLYQLQTFNDSCAHTWGDEINWRRWLKRFLCRQSPSSITFLLDSDGARSLKLYMILIAFGLSLLIEFSWILTLCQGHSGNKIRAIWLHRNSVPSLCDCYREDVLHTAICDRTLQPRESTKM